MPAKHLTRRGSDKVRTEITEVCTQSQGHTEQYGKSVKLIGREVPNYIFYNIFNSVSLS